MLAKKDISGPARCESPVRKSARSYLIAGRGHIVREIAPESKKKRGLSLNAIQDVVNFEKTRLKATAYIRS